MLHPQCPIDRDTVSWARLTAEFTWLPDLDDTMSVCDSSSLSCTSTAFWRELSFPMMA